MESEFKIYRRVSGWRTLWFLAKRTEKGWEYVKFRPDGMINFVAVSNRELIEPFFAHDSFFDKSMGEIVKPFIKAFNTPYCEITAAQAFIVGAVMTSIITLGLIVWGYLEGKKWD